MASPYTLAAADLAAIGELLAAGLPERAGLRLGDVAVRDVRSETRLRFNSPVEVLAWTLAVTATAAGGRRYAGEIELFQWPRDGWELVHDGLD